MFAGAGVQAFADPQDLWQPQVRAIVGADEHGATVAIEGFIPLKQTAESAFFMDLRVNHDFEDSTGADLGFGIRRIVNPDLALGGYGYLSLRENSGNHFTGATLGAEAIGTHFDAHVNVQIPISGEEHEVSAESSLSLVSHQLIEQISVLDRRDYAAWGIEGEVGVQVPLDLPKDHGLRLHIGGYHFADPDNSGLSVSGVKTGFEYSIDDVLGTPGAELVFGGELRYDDRDDANFAGTVRLSIPIGGEDAGDALEPQQPFSLASEGLRKRLNDRVRGDIGVRVEREDTSRNLSRVAINAATNQQFGLFFFADGGNTLGLGTFGDPTTLNDAVANAGADGFIVALGGAGTITTPGATLFNGQTVIGGGQSVSVALADGTTVPFGLGGSDGTIGGTDPGANVLSLANGNTLNGITITGGNNGIFGNNISGATLTNVTVNGAGGNGALFSGTSTGINGSTFTSTGNGGSGLQIAGDGTYSFTGTTTLSGNTVDGLNINGNGTYAFQTLNTLNNGDDGIDITSASGSFSTTGGTVSGNGDQGVKIDPIALNVVLDTISHSGGSNGVELDNVSGSFTVTGATSISGTSGNGISISNSTAAVRFEGGTTIADTGGDGISLAANSGSTTFLGTTLVTNPATGSAAVDIEGTSGTVSFDDLDIALAAAGTTGFDLSNATVNGVITATDFDLTSASPVDTVGVNLVGAGGPATVRLGDTNISGASASIGGTGGNPAGPESGVLLSSSTSLNFIFGDGEATDVLSSITAVTPINATDFLPLGGTYNFLDVTLNGDTSNIASNLDIYYVDIVDDGVNDGSRTNPGTIAGAMASTADAIVLLDSTGGDTIDVASLFQGGGTTLVLDDTQRLFSFLGSDSLAVGGGAPSNFLLTGIAPGVITNPYAGNGAPVLTTSAALANTVTLANSNLLQGVVVANGLGGFAIVGSGIAGVAVTDSAVGGLSLTSATGTAAVTNSTLSHLAIDGGSIDFTGVNADLTNGAAVAAVSVTGGHSGAVSFDAASTVLASAGTGLQFDNADGSYSFNGTTTLNGGDAGIDIQNGSGGTFVFGAGTSITSPTGAGFRIDGSAPASVAYNGTITQNNAAAALLINAMTGGTATFGGAIVANSGNVAISGLSAGAALNVTGALSISGSAGDGLVLTNVAGSATFAGVSVGNAAGDGIALTNNSGTVAFNGQTTITNPGVAGVDIEGTNGAISFADLDISLQTNNSTGLDASNAVLAGNITATDFDLTSTTATGTIGVNINGTTRTASQILRLGDAFVAGQSASIAGVQTGVQISSATSVDFVFGDGEASTDILSSISAVTPIGITGGFPVGGTYNFLDVTLTGDVSNLSSSLQLYYVDIVNDGINDGSRTNPGTIAGAMASSADAIVLLDSTGSDTIDVAALFQGGGTTLVLDANQRLYSFNGGDTLNIGGGAPANFLLTGITSGSITNPYGSTGAPVLTTTAAAANTVSLANGNLLQGVVIANGPGGFAVTGTGIAGVSVVDSAIGGLSLTTATGTATVTNSTLSHLAMSGGSANFTGTNADLTNAAAVAAVSISSGHSGTVSFDAASTVLASAGTGLQFDNADGSYSFNGTTTLNGGDAGIDIQNGSGGIFVFGAGSAITSPSGTAFRIDTSAPASVTYGGTITQNNAASAVLINAMTGGTAIFGGAVTANTGTANAVVLTGNTGATISFNGGLDIDTTSGAGFTATGGGTINVAGAGNSVTSGSGAILNWQDVTVGSGGVTFASLQGTNTIGTAILLSNVDGGTFNGSAVTITDTSLGFDALSISGGSAATFNFASATISDAGQEAIALNGANGPVTFTTVTITNPSGRGIEIDGATANVTINGGSVSGSGGFGVAILNQTSTSTISLSNVAISGSGADTLNISAAAGTITVTGGSLSQTGTSDALDIESASGTISIGSTISNSGTGAAAQAVEIDATSGNVTLSGAVTASNDVQLFNIGSTTAPTAGTILLGGATLSATGNGNAIVGGLGAGATLNVSGAVSIAGASGIGLGLTNVAGTATFGGTVTASTGATNVLVVSGSSGTIGFGGQVTTNSVSGAGFLMAGSTATVGFNGGLSITASASGGFNASGGGTVSVAAAGTRQISSAAGTALSLNGVTIGAAGLNFTSLTNTNAANGITLTSVTSSGGGAINLGTVNFSGITTRGIDVTTSLGAALSIADLDIGLNSTSAVAFDLNGAAINAAITADDFDVTNAAAAGTSIGVDLRGATGSSTVRLGDTVVTGAGADNATIAGVNAGVFLNSATNLAFTYGDGESTTDQLSTISANVAIDASSAPVAGSYNFLDVNFTGSPGLGFGVGKIYFIGRTATGDGSGRDQANLATLTTAEAASVASDVLVLVNDTGIITAAGSNGNDTLVLSDGEQVRGFGPTSTPINLTLTVPPTIQLNAPGISIADATPDGAATLTSLDGTNVITLGSQNNVIDGFILDGSDGVGGNAARGIKDNGAGATNTAVRNMTIRNFANRGIEITPSTSTTVDNVIFSANNQDILLNAANTTISNVTSTGAVGGSIFLDNVSGTTTLTNISIASPVGGLAFGGTSAGTITGTNVDISGSNTLSINSTAGVFSFDAASSLINTGGTAVTINNRSGGSIGFAGSITSNGATSGIAINGATGANTVSFTGTVDLGTTTPLVGTGVLINNAATASTVSFADLDIVTNVATAFTASNGGTVNVTTGTIGATTTQAINLNGVAAGINFASTSSSGGTNNVSLTNVTGSVALGTGALSGAANQAFLVSGGSAAISYGGSVTKTTAGKVVDISSATGGSVALSGAISATGGFDNGISVQNNTGGTFSFSNASKTLSTGGAGAIQILGNSAGTAFNFTNGGLNVNTSSGIGLDVNGSGTVTISGGSNSITTQSGTGFRNTSGDATVTSDASLTTGAGRVVDIQNRTANTVTWSGNITNTGAGAQGITVANNIGGTVTFSGTSKTIDTGANSAVLLSGNGASVNFTNGGLNVDTTSGAGLTISGGGTVVISGAGNTVDTQTGTAFLYSAGDATVTSNAALTTTGAGRVVQIQTHTANAITLSGNITNTGAGALGIIALNNTGGTVTFSGASKALTTGANVAVNLTNNTGATFDFTGGGLVINTTSGVGFNATGGGTVTVQGTGNTIVSSNATALNIANTTIGAAGVTFQSISAGNADASADPVSGIVLNNTGAGGFFTVSGDGSQTAGLYDRDGSGGTIRNTTGDGVSLTNAFNVTLRQMNIASAGLDGVQSTGGGNIVLSAVDITSPGASNPAVGGDGFGTGNGWRAENITGINAFDNNSRVFNWQSSQSNAILLHNTDTDFTSFTVDNALISTSATGAAGFHANLNGTTDGTITLTDSELTLIDQNGAQILNNGSGTITAIVQRNNFHDADATGGDGNNTLFLANAANGQLRFQIGGASAADGNIFRNLARQTVLAGVVQVNAAGGDVTTPAGGGINGFIRNNTISNDVGFVNGRRGIDITVEADSHNLGTIAVDISNNTITNVAKQGINLLVTSVGGGSATDVNFTIANNIVGTAALPVGTEGNADSGSAFEFETNFDSFSSGADIVTRLLLQNNSFVNNNSGGTGDTLDITNRGGDLGTSSVMNVTMLGNSFTNQNATGKAFDILGSGSGVDGTINLDLNSGNTSPNDTTIGASTVGEFQLRQVGGTFNIENLVGGAAAFVSPRNNNDAVTVAGTIGATGAVPLPTAPTPVP